MHTDRTCRAKTNIPVPEVFNYELSADNDIGGPYILMEYMHGTAALELQEQRECEAHVFGTAEQDARFWQQMASIQVQLATLTSDQIGSLHQHQDQDNFTVGPEILTGNGPWETSDQFCLDLANHQFEVAEHDAEPEVHHSESFALPLKFPKLMMQLMQRGQAQSNGPYAMANRDFGAHNVLVDNDFNIVGLIDFDGCMFAPIEAVAQLPLYIGLDRSIPGHIETRELALRRIEKTCHLIPRYVDLVRAATAELEGGAANGSSLSLTDALVSDAASAVQGLDEYGRHDRETNDKWMAAYDMLAQR